MHARVLAMLQHAHNREISKKEPQRRSWKHKNSFKSLEKHSAYSRTVNNRLLNHISAVPVALVLGSWAAVSLVEKNSWADQSVVDADICAGAGKNGDNVRGRGLTQVYRLLQLKYKL